MSDDEGPGSPTAQRFGRYTSEAARAAGYDIDGRRGGGKLAIAKKTGMSPSAVGRMLAGETMPSPRHWASLAETLRRPLRELLIESGTATPESLAVAAEAMAPSRRMAPEEAAERLGIRKPANIERFVSMVEKLLEEESVPGNTSTGTA